MVIYTESHQDRKIDSKVCSCVLKLAPTPSFDLSGPTVVPQQQPVVQPVVFSVTVILHIAGLCVGERHTVPQKHLLSEAEISHPYCPI